MPSVGLATMKTVSVGARRDFSADATVTVPATIALAAGAALAGAEVADVGAAGSALTAGGRLPVMIALASSMLVSASLASMESAGAAARIFCHWAIASL